MCVAGGFWSWFLVFERERTYKTSATATSLRTSTKMIRQGISLFGKALRETGQALDRVGLRVAEKELFNETFSRHRQLMTIFNKVSRISILP
jgi:hypothetical protein